MSRRDATENRAALLAAARRVLNHDPEASLEVIATAAGLSRRSVYGHFANRDELLRELLTVGVARVTGAFTKPPHTDPVIDLCLIATTLWHEVESTRVMTLFAVRGPYRQQTIDELAPLRSRALDDVRRGQAAKEIRADIAAKTLVHLLEQSILAVLDEATATELDDETVRGILLRVMLGLIGFSWHDAAEFIATTAELEWTE